MNPTSGLGRAAGTLLLALLAALLTAAAPPAPQKPAAGVTFTDVTHAAGIDFHLTCGEPEKLYIVSTMCGGAAFLDYDNDGWLDILLIDGATLEEMRKGTGKPPHLYHNNHDGTFTDVTAKSGLTAHGLGMGVAVGDYDNDGWDDLYLTYWGGAVLYRNNGNGTFTDVTARAGVGNPYRWGASAAFGDYDNDGNLDLYVANYVHVDINNLPEFGSGPFCQYRGIPVNCGPRGLLGERDRLYHNNGDGTFTDVTEKLGIDPDGYYGLGVIWTDYDNDGYQDVYIADDSTPSLLYHNNGDGTFSEEGVTTGLALSADGREQAGMGVDAGDYDHDGRIDVVKTNFSDDTNNLYHNDGGGWFTDMAGPAGFARISVPFLAFGVKFVDYDNDGWPDIFVANGHVDPQVDTQSFGVHSAQRNFLFHNRHDGTFDEVGLAAGLTAVQISRGAAAGDFDNDGDIDLLVTNMDDTPQLLRNDGPHGHWLRVKLIGTESNHDGYGARVELVAGGLKQVEEARSASSYLSANDPRLHFGLGGETRVEALVVHWPSGTVDKLEGLAADQEVVIREGAGQVPAVAGERKAAVPGTGRR